MLDRIRTALLWNRAISLASRGRFVESLAITERLVEKRPAALSFVVFQLSLRTTLFKDRVVIEDAPKIVARLEREKPDDIRRKYMIAFVKWLNNISHQRLVTRGEVSDRPPLQVDWTGVDLEMVPREMKRTFPLRNHPHWTERKAPRKIR